MKIYLRCITATEMEKELGIELSEPERTTLDGMRQDSAQKIVAGKIHIYHIPLEILCGSKDAAEIVWRILSPYSDSMKRKITVRVIEA